MGRIEQLTTPPPHYGSLNEVDNFVDKKKPIAVNDVYGLANLEFDIDAGGCTVEEVNGLIEKICEAHEKKRCLSIKVKM